MSRNSVIIWVETCCVPVAASPDICVSAFASAGPLSPNTVLKPGVSVPPELK